MKFWKYYKMGKFIIEKIKRESTPNHCVECYFSFGGECEIYGGKIYGYLRKDECKKEVG